MSFIYLNAEDSQLSKYVLYKSWIIYSKELLMIYTQGLSCRKNVTNVLKNKTMISSAPHYRLLQIHSMSIYTKYQAQKHSGKKCRQGGSSQGRNTYVPSALSILWTVFQTFLVPQIDSKSPVSLMKVCSYISLALYLTYYGASLSRYSSQCCIPTLPSE